MPTFVLLHGSSVILKQRGVYKQSELYHYNGGLFAKHDSGYVRLLSYDNGTSVPNVHWENAYTGIGKVEMKFDNIGRALWDKY